MKRLWVHVCCALLVAGAAGAVVSACAHDDSTMFVYAEIIGTESNNVCTLTADPTQHLLSSGILDTALNQQYVGSFLLANQMAPQGDPTVPKTETSFIVVQRADVRITDVNNHELTRFSTRTTTEIPPATGTTPGLATIQAVLVDQATVLGLPAIAPGATVRLETFIRFFGTTRGGQSVESDEFSFPVDLCFGCLVNFPVAEINAKFNPPLNCGAAGAAGTTSSAQTPCFVGQDQLVDCSLCLDNPVCNPPLVPLDAGTD